MQFGRLTVLERADNAKDGSSRWLCQCNCEEHNKEKSFILIKKIITK